MTRPTPRDRERTEPIKWTDRYSRELHKPVRFKFKKRRVFSPGPNSIWAADLADLQKFSRSNKGYRYLLLVIDVFTKYGYIRPLKKKTGKATAAAFKDIFGEAKTSPKRMWLDKGKEFYNTKVNALFDEYNVKMYSTENELKSTIVERWIRTIKRIMWKYFTAARTRNYISIISNLVDKYNSTRHSTIRCTPKEAREPENFSYVFNNLYPDEKIDRKQPFRVGDRVRIARKKGHFEKGYEPNWSEELFKVVTVQRTNPRTYKLEDMESEPVIGTFYRQNLLKSTQDIYFIDKVLAKRVKKGVKEVKVQWSGYGKSFNEWIPEEDVIDTRDDDNPVNTINTSVEREGVDNT